VVLNGIKMKFKIKSKQVDNSHPAKKIALREWVIANTSPSSVLDVYGGGGMMFEKVWSIHEEIEYGNSIGDALEFLNKQNSFNEDVFDIDPYASPYEAVEIICGKSTKNKIGIVCTDGTLRRVAMMRTGIPEFFQTRCGWKHRDLSLMAAIYHRYPSFLRHVLKCICGEYSVEKLVVQYGIGTWRQATCYFAATLIKL
jgi:hypothetical protein